MATERQDVVRAAVADVVRPTVATDDPDALRTGSASRLSSRTRVRRAGASRGSTPALGRDARPSLCGVEELRRTSPSEPASPRRASVRAACWSTRGGNQPELRVVLEERVDQADRGRRGGGEGRGAGFRRRSTRAARNVHHQGAVAEGCVSNFAWGLATARAGSGVLEERLEELAAFTSRGRGPSGRERGRRRNSRVQFGEAPARHHVDRLARGMARSWQDRPRRRARSPCSRRRHLMV